MFDETLTINKNLYKVATLSVDLSDVPAHKFKSKRSATGGLYYTIHFNVELSVMSSLEYSMSVNGTQYGSVTASYT